MLGHVSAQGVVIVVGAGSFAECCRCAGGVAVVAGGILFVVVVAKDVAVKIELVGGVVCVVSCVWW